MWFIGLLVIAILLVVFKIILHNEKEKEKYTNFPCPLCGHAAGDHRFHFGILECNSYTSELCSDHHWYSIKCECSLSASQIYAKMPKLVSEHEMIMIGLRNGAVSNTLKGILRDLNSF